MNFVNSLPVRVMGSCPCLMGYFPSLVVYARTHFFNIFKLLNSRNRKCASFSLLRNLITRLHQKFLTKLRKNYKNIAFRGRLTANCTLMADSIRVAQPIRLQYLHYSTNKQLDCELEISITLSPRQLLRIEIESE